MQLNLVIVVAILGLLLSGCAKIVTPERDKYASYDCPNLKQELIQIGAIKSEATDNQSGNMGRYSAQLLAGRLGGNMQIQYNAFAERQAKTQIDILYEIWDQKRCSEYFYQLNRQGTQTGSR